MAGKPGYAKYQGFRGPHPGRRAEHLAFWLNDLKQAQAQLSQDIEARDARLVRLSRKNIKLAEEELTRYSPQELSQEVAA